MKVTEVKVFKVDKGNLKGYASITLDGAFVVTGLKVVEGSKGLFVNMPQQKVKEEYKDICFPLNKELRENIVGVVIQKFSEGQDDFRPVDDQDDSLPF